MYMWECSAKIFVIKSEKHQNYVKFKKQSKKPTDSVDKLIKNLIEEKMKILQNMIDKFNALY